MKTVTWEKLIIEEKMGRSGTKRCGDRTEQSQANTEGQQTKRRGFARRITSDKNPIFGWAIPRNEKSLAFKVAKKLLNKRSKKSLDGVYEVLAPGSTAIKKLHVSTIKEYGKKEVTICNSDIAKFGTKVGRKKSLTEYVKPRPSTLSGKTIRGKN